MYSWLFFLHNLLLIACVLGLDSSCMGKPSTISMLLSLLLTMTWQECWVHGFVSPKRRAVNPILILHCVIDIHVLGACTSGCAFTFPFTLSNTTLPLSNLVNSNDTDVTTQHSSSAHHASSVSCASSAFCALASCLVTAASFHWAHVGCTSSILVMMWPVTCGSMLWSFTFWRLTSNILCTG